MQSHALTIGRSIAGLSVPHHHCQEGWTDLVHLERNELTSGTTSHDTGLNLWCLLN